MVTLNSLGAGITYLAEGRMVATCLKTAKGMDGYIRTNSFSYRNFSIATRSSCGAGDDSVRRVCHLLQDCYGFKQTAVAEV